MKILLEYSDRQIAAFKNKYGEDTYNLFLKSRDRLKNAGETTDIEVYLSNKWSKEALEKLLNNLDKEVSDKRGRYTTAEMNQEWKPEGEYKYLGQHSGFDIYQPLDVKASMSLGVNTGWCTTGRYGHAGHPEFKPSYREAEDHWNEYTEEGIKFVYLLDPKTHHGEYAIVVYNNYAKNVKMGDYLLEFSNIDIYDSNDKLDFSIANIPGLLDFISDKSGLETRVSIRKLEIFTMRDDTLLAYGGKDEYIAIPNSVRDIGEGAFSLNSSLKSVVLPGSLLAIDAWAFSNCVSLNSIIIPDSVVKIGDHAFNGCTSLVVKCNKGSYADSYCIENEIKYEVI